MKGHSWATPQEQEASRKQLVLPLPATFLSPFGAPTWRQVAERFSQSQGMCTAY